MEKSITSALSFFLLLLVAGTSGAQLSAAGVRDIDNQNLIAGQSTNATVTITSIISQALAFQEKLPDGWSLIRISDDANSFKDGTKEWLWFNAGAGAEKTIRYMLTVPADAARATYIIQGSVSNASGIIASVTGKNSIVVSGGAQTSSLLKMDVRVNPAKPKVSDNISLQVELIYPSAGYMVEFGEASVKDKTISVDIKTRPPAGVAAQVITTYSHVYEIGYPGAGYYAYDISINGAYKEKGSFEVVSIKSAEPAPAPDNTTSPVETVKTPGFTLPVVVILICYMLFKFKLRGRKRC